MGYYSDAGLALSRRGIEKLEANLSIADSRIQEEVENLFKYADEHFEDSATGAKIWHWKDIKWYTGEPERFPEINFLEEFIDELDDEDFRFIRIGEEYDDNETRGAFWEETFELRIMRCVFIGNSKYN